MAHGLANKVSGLIAIGGSVVILGFIGKIVGSKSSKSPEIPEVQLVQNELLDKGEPSKRHVRRR